jgi:hypothetical protein
MNPEPAVQADQPFVMDVRIWRGIVIALYLAASSASAVLAPGSGNDLVRLPELVWIANIVVVLAAIALARARASLRLQLALAFAMPVLYVVLLSGWGAFFGESRVWAHVQMLGFLLYTQFLGSVVAFGIALASGVEIQRPVGPSVFPRMFSVLGWVLVAMWVYMHGFELAAEYLPGSRPYLDGLLLRILWTAGMVAWVLSPLWVVGSIALALSARRRKQGPALSDVVVLLLVFCLMGLYIARVFLLD